MSNQARFVCVAPLTPTYSTLPRLNTTALVLFVVLSPTSTWATKGALAALMVRASTISIHAIVMLATKDVSRHFELDSIVAWFILSEVAVATPIMLCWAAALRGSKARGLVKMWSVVVFVGAVCGYVTVRWARTNVDNRSCHDDMDGAMVFVKSDIFSGFANRASLGRFDIAAIAAASSGLWVNLRSARPWASQAGSSAVQSMLKYLDVVVLIFAAVILVATIVLHELYLLQTPRLPMLLPVTSYEQWNCWVAASLILVATVINWLLGSWKRDTSQQKPSWRTTFSESGNDYQQHRDCALLQTSSHSLWSMKLPGGQPSSTKLWPGSRTDLEWAGVVGRPTPSYIG